MTKLNRINAELLAKKITVKVTATDINSGTPGCPITCPVAIATQRAVSAQTGLASRHIEVDVTPTHIAVDLWGEVQKLYKILTPRKVSAFIMNFDSGWGREFNPFTFEILLDETSLIPW